MSLQPNAQREGDGSPGQAPSLLPSTRAADTSHPNASRRIGPDESTEIGAPSSNREDSKPPPASSRAPRDRLDLWKDCLAVVQSVATVAGLVLAGWWFFRQDISAPHVNLTQTMEILKIHEKWQLVRLNVRLTNVGVVPMTVSSAYVYIAQVLPLDGTIRQNIDAGVSPVDAKRGQIPFPVLGEPYVISPNAELWPGESENYDFDFLIPANICQVMLHSRFTSKSAPGLNWTGSNFQKVGDCNQ